MLMVHGAFCGGWAYDDWKSFFGAAGWRCDAPDLLYHDRPARTEPDARLGSTSLTDFADALERRILDGATRPVIVGHSMGGLLAQMLAARNLARALVLLAPSAPWGVLPSSEGEFAAALGVLASGAVFHQPVRPVFEIAASHALHRLDHRRQRAVYGRFVPESGRALTEVLHWPFDFRMASAVPAWKVRCPVLVLSGSEDRVNTPATVRRVAARYGNRASFEMLDGHAHWLVGEADWEVVARKVADWLDQLVESGG